MTSFLPNVLWAALEASVLAIAIACAIKIWKFNAPLRHTLWLLVVLKLLVPPVAVHSFGLSGACNKGFAILKSTIDSGEDAAHEIQERFRPYEDVAPVEERVEEDKDLIVQEEIPGSPDTGSPHLLEPSTHDTVDDPVLSIASGGAPPDTPVTSRYPKTSTEEQLLPIPLSIGSHEKTGEGFTAPDAGLLCFLIWLAGALSIGIIQLLRINAIQRHLRNATAAPANVDLEIGNLARRMGLRRPPEVKVVQSSISPMVWSWGRPVAVLSASITRASNRALRSLLAHELAHLKRRDHWICWLELLGSCLYWWLPTFWWARRGMRTSADEAADAWAVRVTGSRETYAESLLETVEVLKADALSAPLFGHGVGQRESIARRLTMIMRDPLHHRLSVPARIATILTAILVLPVAPSGVQGQVATSPPGQELEEKGEEVQVPSPARTVIDQESDKPAEVEFSEKAKYEKARRELEKQQAILQEAELLQRLQSQNVHGDLKALEERQHRLKVLEKKVELLDKKFDDLRDELRAVLKKSGPEERRTRTTRGRTSARRRPVPVEPPEGVVLSQAYGGAAPFVARSRKGRRPAAAVKVETLVRATYKLPEDKAKALAAFLREHMEEEDIDVSVQDTVLVITARDDIHRAMGPFIELMFRRKANPEERGDKVRGASPRPARGGFGGGGTRR